MEFIRAQIWEIKRSEALRIFAFIIALFHVYTFFSWFSGQESMANQVLQGTNICWSHFPKCHNLNLLFEQGWLFSTYLAAASIAGLLFVANRALVIAWSLMAFCLGLYLATYFANFNLANNTSTFFVYCQFGFLFLPSKPRVLRFLIFGYYFFSGFNNLNPDWASGHWLKPLLNLSQKGVEWVAAICIIIELIVPVFLFSRDWRKFGAAALLLLLYHAGQGWAFGWAPALVHGGFVLFFIFYFFEIKQRDRESYYQSFARPEPTSLWAPILFLIFCGIQSTFHFKRTVHWDWPLRMRVEGVPPECHHYQFVNLSKLTRHLPDDSIQSSMSRLKCRKEFHYQASRSLCTKLQLENGFQSLSSFFVARSIYQKNYTRIFEHKNICGDASQ